MLSGSEISSSSTGSKVGIFGGAFDPVHVGHIIVCLYTLEILELDRLVVVPAYNPPHKKTSIPFEKRFEWLKKVFGGIEKIEVSDYERQRGGVSYSIFTIEHFSNLYKTKPFFIVGEDALSYFEKWYRYRDILEKANLVVYPRYCGKPYHEHARKVLGDLSKIIFLDMPIIQISSTEIRKRALAGKTLKGFVPEEIREEVEAFYGQSGTCTDGGIH
ncbi:nicotinate (nicotinamide) nucleotide adenylyltransferase [Thermotoga neapolitana]|uniref:nicotinate (nicotinamide) nucleotide adenylyltransferase n=1 Tax=Thermotoga neapolitana TaxID=2337 RepID=UPI00056EE494|nr:nicotinate (nicotinamide) nucleotide adenylyltransferase [Thermotoga neapolitana]MDK2785942.1 nicotinate-nucleotide adenylyltransferase [Thermotoga sp.]HBF11694.1 nicotinate (nicotinamide) nucleotide adenylyltransferase [Thermotoga neapolitana]